MPTQARLSAPARQRGAALITGLIFLVVLTIIVVAGLRSSTLEERMAANARNRVIALQAAESALRDAELRIRNNAMSLTFTDTCTGGLCTLPIAGSAPRWQGYAWTNAAVTSVPTTTVTAPGINGTNQPRYFIEIVNKPTYSGTGLCPREVYRVTARGRAADNTEVLLETLYRVQPSTC